VSRAAAIHATRPPSSNRSQRPCRQPATHRAQPRCPDCRIGLREASVRGLDDVGRRVADVDAALVAVEQRRRDCDIAVGGEAVADAADVAVDAEISCATTIPRVAFRRIGA